MRSSLRVLLIAAVAASAGLTAAPTATAALVTPADLSIRTGTIMVHTANHQSWKMSIGAAEDGGSGSSSDPGSVTYGLSEALVRSVTKPSRGIEVHAWSVGGLPESTLSFDPDSGDGALTTPSSTAHLTTVNLAFHATRHHSLVCSSGSETVYTGTLTGRATLITGLKNGGTVGGQNLSFKAGSTQVDVDNQCENAAAPSPNKCGKVTEFESTDQQQHEVFGLKSGAATQVTFAHIVHLKHPVDAGREDGVIAVVPAPVFDRGAKTLRVFGTKSGVLTGSATLTRGTLKKVTQKCTLKSVKHTETGYVNQHATFTNTKGHPLVGHSALTGKLTIPNGARAAYLVATWK